MIEAGAIDQLRQAVDLAAVVGRAGVDLTGAPSRLRGLCPFHAEKSPSFMVMADGRGHHFHCYGCGEHGDAIDFLRKLRGLSFSDAVDELAAEFGVHVGRTKAEPRALAPKARFRAMPAARAGHVAMDPLAGLQSWRLALPGSPGEAYLRQRRIPLDVAQALGVGFLPPGHAMGADEQGKPIGYGPRVVFPHMLRGELVNLYGRSIDADADKAKRHRHLPRPKGLLNEAALELPGELWIVEGAFDVAALLAAGVQKVVGIFGLEGFDWRWIGRHDLVIATDHDDSGEVAAGKLLTEAAYRGLKARRLPASVLGGCKDASEAWQAGVLALDQCRPATAPSGEPAGLNSKPSEPGPVRTKDTPEAPDNIRTDEAATNVRDDDPRVTCQACANFTGRCCTAWRRTGFLQASEVSRDLAALPQHCPAFSLLSVTLDQTEQSPELNIGSG